MYMFRKNNYGLPLRRFYCSLTHFDVYGCSRNVDGVVGGVAAWRRHCAAACPHSSIAAVYSK